MTHEFFVGFRTQPFGIEKFLEKEGYVPNETVKDPLGAKIFQREDEIWPQTFYYKDVDNLKRADPIWEKLPHRIVSELDINYPSEQNSEAERLMERIVRSFDGILYDADANEFYTKDEL